jgi:hypothetical protein
MLFSIGIVGGSGTNSGAFTVTYEPNETKKCRRGWMRIYTEYEDGSPAPGNLTEFYLEQCGDIRT